MLIATAAFFWNRPPSGQSGSPQTARGFTIEPGAVPASDTFKRLLLDPIPDTVTDLQGNAETYQGYGAYLRFKTDRATLDQIIATGFQFYHPPPNPPTHLGLHTAPVFTPTWAPGSIANPEYYQADVQNDWTHSGKHYLIVDPISGTVHFIGHGS